MKTNIYVILNPDTSKSPSWIKNTYFNSPYHNISEDEEAAIKNEANAKM